MSRPADPNAKINLLAAAEEVFVKRGLDAATIEEITGRAGLSKGAFYLHFESKEQAFRHLIESVLASLARFTDARFADPKPEFPSVQAFLDYWVNRDVSIFEFIWQNRALVGLLLEGGNSAAFRYLIDEFADRSSCTTRALLQLGIERGLYRSDLDVDTACAFICGGYDRLARLTVRGKERPDFRALLGKLQAIVLRGIASDAMLAQLGKGTP